MIQDPMDMVAEMDELFNRIFSRMDREFSGGPFRGHEYRTFFEMDEGPEEITRAPGPAPKTSSEPVTEVHTIGNEVKVVTELPGATEDEIRLRVRGDSLVIDAGDGDHHCHTTTALPPVDEASMQQTFRNGILEVTFRLLPDTNGRN